ncbi:CHAT domain-containing protein [Brasilonema sp. UFV-L1]|uniref:CHAT domain-containing protein n=1 Tax=Brasilonema sp. UFV-L1 TaxID=2234130 RepID=UPI001B7D2946|nr:CHAT domain-containing protein [Brasilonema sp. UFV-L1]
MSKLVIFSLLGGDLNQGFPVVTVQLWHNNQFFKITGSLPAVPELSELYRRWQLLYCAVHQRLGSNQRIKVHSQDITNISVNDFDEVCHQLQAHINAWLKSESFQNIERQLRTLLSRDDEIRVIFETNIALLHRLPWHLWNFFEDYPKAELALSNHEYASVQVVRNSSTGKVKILAILGNSFGIDIEKDRCLLQGLTDAQTTFLVEPTRRELDEQLWNQDWDILFFAGHSASIADGEFGEIYINQSESLTISQFKNALKTAIARGLKLAIFNSCDGIGLARNLADLNIPQMIMMREPVPDLVAQEFLKNFLVAFAGGKPFYLAVREARERLQGLENNFPCASWLPLICQNPTFEPLTWQEMKNFPSRLPTRRWRLLRTVPLGVLTTALVIILQLLIPSILPFQKKLPTKQGIPPTTHTVQAGEILFDIAKVYYGDGNKWQKITAANGNIKPESLQVGQKLTIPADTNSL